MGKCNALIFSLIASHMYLDAFYSAHELSTEPNLPMWPLSTFIDINYIFFRFLFIIFFNFFFFLIMTRYRLNNTKYVLNWPKKH